MVQVAKATIRLVYVFDNVRGVRVFFDFKLNDSIRPKRSRDPSMKVVLPLLLDRSLKKDARTCNMARIMFKYVFSSRT